MKWNLFKNVKYENLSLRVKLSLLFGSLLSITVLTYVIIDYWQFQKVFFHKAATRRLPIYLQAKKTELSTQIARSIETASLLAKHPYVLAFLSSDESAGVLQTNFQLQIKQLIEQGYPLASVVSAQSLRYYTYDKNQFSQKKLKQDNPHDEWYWRMIQSKEKIVFEYDYNQQTDKSLLFINILVGDLEKPLGIAALSVDPSAILQKLEQSKITKNSQSWLLNEKGQIVFSKEREQIGMSLEQIIGSKPLQKLLSNADNSVLFDVPISKENHAVVSTSLATSGYKIVSASPNAELFSFIHLKNGWVVWITIAALLLSFVVVVILVNGIVAPIQSLQKSTLRFVQGELDIQIEKKVLRRNDEIGSLAHSFLSLQEMQAKINHALEQARNVSQGIYQGTLNLKESSSKLAHSSNEQVVSTQEISTVISEMVALVIESNEAVEQTRSIFDEATETSKKGEVSLEGVIAVIREIFNKIEVVQEISGQTNILSLNAAIEAARAGDTGRGFIVVSEEVQNLASVTRKSATEINDLAMQTVEISQNTGKIFGVLSKNINNTSVLLSELIERSKTQTQKAEEINVNIQELEKAAKENAQISSRIDSLIDEFQEEITSLDNLVNEFKT